MTKRERFMKFLANEPVDRVPVAFFHHFCGPDLMEKGMELPESFERNIEGHREALAVFDPDVIKVMNDSLMILPLDTSFVKKPSDLRKIQPPSVNSPFGKKTKELTQRVMEIYEGKDAPIYATGFSAIRVLRGSLDGMTNPNPRLPKWLEEDPDSVFCALDILTDTIIEYNEMLLKECGVDGMYFSVQNRNQYFPDEMFTKFVTPSDLRIMEHANKLSKMNLLHICGFTGARNNLELFKNYPAAAYNIAVYAEKVSLSEGRKVFNGKPVFGGFAQEGIIDKGTREEVKEATWKILDECGQVGVMIGADCTVPYNIDDDRFNWVRDAAIEYAEKH